MVGELALSGEIRRVRGVLPITLEMRKKSKKVILVPENNARAEDYLFFLFSAYKKVYINYVAGLMLALLECLTKTLTEWRI